MQDERLTAEITQQEILKSLRGERHSRLLPWFQSLLAALVISSSAYYFLRVFGPESIRAVHLMLVIVFGLLSFIGFGFYFQPTPHLSPAGYWTRWNFSKLLLLMSAASIIEILICPQLSSLAFHDDGPIRLFTQLTDYYMEIGGHDFCMFMCGVTFTGFGALVSFPLFAQSLRLARATKLLTISLIALLGQLPIILLQLIDSEGRAYLGYWFAGSAGILLLLSFGYRFVFSLKSK